MAGNEQHSGVLGLVLAGGESKRMGRDKYLISYHGKPQAVYLYDLLSHYCKKVFISCRPEQNIPAEMNPLPDAYEIRGPLNGILSAFKLDAVSPWLVIAVDMPNIDTRGIHDLLAKRDESKYATCYLNEETNQPEPLLTIWEPRALPLLLDGMQRGFYSPRQFLADHPVNIIRPYSNKLLVNVNYQRDIP